MTTEPHDYRADLLHLIGYMGDMTIPVRTETFARLLAEAGAPRTAESVGNSDKAGWEIEAAALEAFIKIAEAAEVRRGLLEDSYGDLTADATKAGIAYRTTEGENAMPVRDAAGRILFLVMPDANGFFAHVDRIRLSGKVA